MKREFAFLLLSCFIILPLFMTSCNTTETQDEVVSPAIKGDVITAIALSSTAFKEGDRIPVKYTCDGEDISPALLWNEPPQLTESFVLIVDDPDAPGGVFTHWILFNIPTNIRQFGEGVPTQEQLENGALQGRNDFGRIGYGGPCPPSGRSHRYQFTIYALDQRLNLKAGVSKKQVIDAMQGHILAKGQLTGAYQR